MSVGEWFRDAAGLMADIVQMASKFEKGRFFYFSGEENSRGTSGQSAYLKILSLVPKLFAFLVKWSLEGAFSVLFSSLGTLWFI